MANATPVMSPAESRPSMGNGVPVVGPQPPKQIADTETYSENILGPVYFKLSNLRVKGTNAAPAALKQSPYIIASNEQFDASVDIEFSDNPLTRLLLCLGTQIHVDFAFEGVGGEAAEVDLKAWKVTKKNKFEYTVTFTGTPAQSGLTPGFYAIAGVVSIGPADHPCAQFVMGYGYIAGAFLQVYEAF